MHSFIVFQAKMLKKQLTTENCMLLANVQLPVAASWILTTFLSFPSYITDNFTFRFGTGLKKTKTKNNSVVTLVSSQLWRLFFVILLTFYRLGVFSFYKRADETRYNLASKLCQIWSNRDDTHTFKLVLQRCHYLWFKSIPRLHIKKTFD